MKQKPSKTRVDSVELSNLKHQMILLLSRQSPADDEAEALRHGRFHSARELHSLGVGGLGERFGIFKTSMFTYVYYPHEFGTVAKKMQTNAL